MDFGRGLSGFHSNTRAEGHGGRSCCGRSVKISSRSHTASHTAECCRCVQTLTGEEYESECVVCVCVGGGEGQSEEKQTQSEKQTPSQARSAEVENKKEEFPGFMKNMRPGNSFPQICVVSVNRIVEN